jgi:uncharacterized protein YciI
MPWFVKIEHGIVDKATFDQFVPAHKVFVQQLNAQGHQATTGYWRESRGGMLLFQAESFAQAQQIVAQDPLIINGCVEYELHEWVAILPPKTLNGSDNIAAQDRPSREPRESNRKSTRIDD